MREMGQMSLQRAAYLGFAFPVKKALVAALPPPPSQEALLRNTVTGSLQTFGESPLSLLPINILPLPF